MWFKVSDDMTEHPKVKAMPRGPKRKLALATWLGCGTWCQGGLTDGLVSLDVVLDKGGTKPEAALLVQVGLWHDRNSTCDHAPDQCPGPPSGAGEYTFHDWFLHYPSRRMVMDQRAKARPAIPVGLRTAVYDRDGWRCVTCAADSPLSLDHIHPYSLGGPDTFANLQTMCVPCNSRKGARV